MERGHLINIALFVSGRGGFAIVQVFFCGDKFFGVQAQKFHNLGFNLVAQIKVFVQQRAYFFASLPELFRAKGKPRAALVDDLGFNAKVKQFA